MSVPEVLLFPVADMLQTTLHLIGDGYKSHAVAHSKVGYWKLDCEMAVKSDVLTEEVASFFVKVRKNLWLYVISSSRGNKLNCIVFDAGLAKMSPSFMATACGQGNLNATIKRLTSINALIYSFDAATKSWLSCTTLEM
jgi:hypothetical protein